MSVLKIALVAACLVVFSSYYAEAAPSPRDIEMDEQYIINEERADRQRRVTCDLLSFLHGEHTFCAAHCVARGKTGGRCQGGVCVCRSSTWYN